MECLNTQHTPPSTALVTMDSDMVSSCWSRSQIEEIRSWFQSLSQVCGISLGLGLKQCGLGLGPIFYPPCLGLGYELTAARFSSTTAHNNFLAFLGFGFIYVYLL